MLINLGNIYDFLRYFDLSLFKIEKYYFVLKRSVLKTESNIIM